MAKTFSLAKYILLLVTRVLGVLATSTFNKDSTYIAQSCIRACGELSAQFADAFHYGDDDPDFAIWDMKQQEARPACRVEPSTPAEVAAVIGIVVTSWCRFAVKGGGHSTNFDASNSAGGVTIDLHNMNHVKLSDDHTRADLGPGLVLVEAYRALEPYNLTFVGGRVADVGLPGFTLGGGISNLSPQYGLAVDNVFEYEVVLPNATIVTANVDTNPDLYFALRGGGNNFGIVTNFRARIVPQGHLLGGDITFHSNYTDQIVDQVYRLTTDLADDTYMCFSSRYAYDQAQDRFQISLTEAYYQPVLKPAVFDAVNELPNESSTVRIDRMSNFALDAVAPQGLRRIYATLTYRPSRILHSKLLEIFSAEVEGVKTTPGFTSSIVIQALHVNAIKAMKERGGNALGVESGSPLNIVALLTLGWSNAEDDKEMYSYADRWMQQAKDQSIQMGLFHPWLYINYANYNQDPFSGYGEVNKRRLEAIQRTVDPKGVFTSTGLCRGSFKVL
ncbi:unnamed protein product [Clonostachys rosea]|uniref:FAD-binding PCMH-type domain-containing protein n=1 Tax=Bionectria ochroleuca TaxID=29856 RepID=A0ABY6UI97_BIOOC|nr:unnamed protein product [Clonostachys rosea]